MTGGKGPFTMDTVSPRRVIDLTHARADGWFAKLGEGSPSFAQLSEVLGERFLAFSIIAGVRIASVTIDRQSPDATLVDFTVGDDTQEHRLPLGELRRRLVATLCTDDVAARNLPQKPQASDLQAFMGFRYVLLSPVFGLTLLELMVGGDLPPTVRVDLGGAKDEIELSVLRDLLHERVRQEGESVRPKSPFAIDLSAIPRALAAASDDDWAAVIALIGSWPGPLSLLLRTAEGQSLAAEVRGNLAQALGLLGTAYVHTGRHAWAEEVMRLGIQWGQESPGSGDLFERLGQAMMAQDRPAEAIGLFRRALMLGASEASVLPQLARCYTARGKRVAAMGCLRAARRAGAFEHELHDQEAELAEALGEPWARACALLEKRA
ncbi:MAG: hypothetical protein GW913_11970 [Myxococcales bacterium]|nr:hypothetical protein [Myxococcales bacterium]